MPHLVLKTNVDKSPAQQQELCKTFSHNIASLLNKSENYVMVEIDANQTMCFAGSEAACAFIALKSIGLTQTQIDALTIALCEQAEQSLSVPAERVYIEFKDVPRSQWGWNKKTF